MSRLNQLNCKNQQYSPRMYIQSRLSCCIGIHRIITGPFKVGQYTAIGIGVYGVPMQTEMYVKTITRAQIVVTVLYSFRKT